MADALSSDDLATLLSLTEEGRGEDPGPIMPWFLFERIAARGLSQFSWLR